MSYFDSASNSLCLCLSLCLETSLLLAILPLQDCLKLLLWIPLIQYCLQTLTHLVARDAADSLSRLLSVLKRRYWFLIIPLIYSTLLNLLLSGFLANFLLRSSVGSIEKSLGFHIGGIGFNWLSCPSALEFTLTYTLLAIWNVFEPSNSDLPVLIISGPYWLTPNQMDLIPTLAQRLVLFQSSLRTRFLPFANTYSFSANRNGDIIFRFTIEGYEKLC